MSSPDLITVARQYREALDRLSRAGFMLASLVKERMGAGHTTIIRRDSKEYREYGSASHEVARLEEILRGDRLVDRSELAQTSRASRAEPRSLRAAK